MAPLHIQLVNSTLRRVIKRLHFPLEVRLVCVRWDAAYPLSLRNLEEMMAERGVEVYHATVHRWALKMLPVLAKVFRRRKRPVGASWRVDETYMLVGGQWKYLNNIVKQDHRAIKRRTRPMMGFKSFWSATKIIIAIETMHMIKKGQLCCPYGRRLSAAEKFYRLAF